MLLVALVLVLVDVPCCPRPVLLLLVLWRVFLLLVVVLLVELLGEGVMVLVEPP